MLCSPSFFFLATEWRRVCVGFFFFFLFSLSCGNFLFLYDFTQACFFLAIFRLFPFPKVVSPIYNQFITDLTFYQVWLLISRMRDRSFFLPSCHTSKNIVFAIMPCSIAVSSHLVHREAFNNFSFVFSLLYLKRISQMKLHNAVRTVHIYWLDRFRGLGGAIYCWTMNVIDIVVFC